MKNILVTGATGFIGRALTERLQLENYKVFVLARKSSQNLHFINTSLSELILFEKFEEIPNLISSLHIDVVFHLATLYLRGNDQQDINALIESNITLGTQVLEGVKQARPQFIISQSFFQYINNAPKPSSLYSATKLSFTEIAKFYERNFDFPLTELVFFETYGPGDTRNKLIPQLIAASQKSDHFVIQEKNVKLNLVYISDAVDALLSVMGRSGSEIFAVRPEFPIAITDVAKEVSYLANEHFEIKYGNDEFIADPNLAGSWMTPPDWIPKISFSDGLNLCISSFKKN